MTTAEGRVNTYNLLFCSWNLRCFELNTFSFFFLIFPFTFALRKKYALCLEKSNGFCYLYSKNVAFFPGQGVNIYIIATFIINTIEWGVSHFHSNNSRWTEELWFTLHIKKVYLYLQVKHVEINEHNGNCWWQLILFY